jgi:hypothetical protein
VPRKFADDALLDLDVHLILNIILSFFRSMAASHSRLHQSFQTLTLSFYIAMHIPLMLYRGSIWQFGNASTIKTYGTHYNILEEMQRNHLLGTEENSRQSLVLHFDNAKPHTSKCIDVYFLEN